MLQALRSIGTVNQNEIHPLNGFRALAIIFVLLFHYHCGIAVAGNYKSINNLINIIFTNMDHGVDIFLILSGFLISAELYKRWYDKKIYFRVFYLKRALKIIPPYYFYLLIIFLFLSIQLSAIKYAPVTPSTPAKIALIANILGSFAVDVLLLGNILMGGNIHLWAVAIEVQFYILFSVIRYFILFKHKPHDRLLALVISYFIILVIRIVIIFNFKNVNFDSSHEWYHIAEKIRFDSIILGIILMEVYYHHKDFIKLLKNYQINILLVVGISIVAASFIHQHFFDYKIFKIIKFNLFSIGYLLIIFSALAGNGILARFFSLPIFIPIARVSYTMYLWHLFTSTISIGLTGIVSREINALIYAGVFLFYLLITFLFLVLLYSLIEYPCSRLKERLVTSIELKESVSRSG